MLTICCICDGNGIIVCDEEEQESIDYEENGIFYTECPLCEGYGNIEKKEMNNG